jgi:hypothetical protein
MKKVTVYYGVPAAWVHISGDDAPDFLQSQFSNDIRNSQDREVTYGLWLNRKGRVIADSFLLRGDGNAYRAVSYFSRASDLVAKLDENIIADDVVLANHTEKAGLISWWGGGAEDLLKAFGWENPAKGTYVETALGPVFRGRRSREANFDLVASKDRVPEFVDLLGRQSNSLSICRATEESLFGSRIKAGIPAVPQDIGPDDLPQEGSLEGDAVSFTKGCYLGQEVMARLQSMGRRRRGLFMVNCRLEDLPDNVPCKLFRGKEAVGDLRSVGTFDGGVLGHALLKLDAIKGADAFSFTPDGPQGVTLPCR